MALLILTVVLAVALSHVCSLLEITLFAVRISTLLDRQSAGSRGAARLLEIKQHRIDDAIGAILTLNTLAIAAGSALAGAQAAALFGETWLVPFSVALTMLLLVVSEIIPKALAARYAGRLSGFVGHVLFWLTRLMAPVLLLTRALIRLIARRPGERLTRREFAMLVGNAPQDGAISLGESMLIGSLIYSREVTLRDVMTPSAVLFMMEAEQTVDALLAATGADAFSRIPLFRGERRHVIGYLSHRDVLKAYALDRDGSQRLAAFLHPLPRLRETVAVAQAFDRILEQRESIALVTDERDEPVGIVTQEDLLEAMLGMEITDEADAVATLRPAVAHARKQRAALLRRKRMKQHPLSEVQE
jgi:CBS domain containing-hemolysin-like protein